ncbi:hypothetical protein Aglo01_48790 [Actinokineospora globicatena]|nr:hypothetical protein Aglo01_48790 [Actinokineospora globicatena]GLW87227.1 hypothetical protein Aglo02_48660 [Actinokineospora globicatena]
MADTRSTKALVPGRLDGVDLFVWGDGVYRSDAKAREPDFLQPPAHPQRERRSLPPHFMLRSDQCGVANGLIPLGLSPSVA